MIDLRDETTPADRKQHQPIFVHSVLDDYGLTPTQFRVFAHVARRAHGLAGVCNEKLENISKAVGLHEDTVRPVLTFLVERRLLSRKFTGDFNEYRLSPITEWQPNPALGNFPSPPKIPRVSPPKISLLPSEKFRPQPSENFASPNIVEGHPFEGNLKGAAPRIASQRRGIKANGSMPNWKKLKVLEEDRLKHPCNPHSVNHRTNTTEVQRVDYAELCRKIRVLRAEQSQEARQ